MTAIKKMNNITLTSLPFAVFIYWKQRDSNWEMCMCFNFRPPLIFTSLYSISLLLLQQRKCWVSSWDRSVTQLSHQFLPAHTHTCHVLPSTSVSSGSMDFEGCKWSSLPSAPPAVLIVAGVNQEWWQGPRVKIHVNVYIFTLLHTLTTALFM